MPYADGRSHMNLLLVEDVEYVDPIIHMATMYINAVVSITLQKWRADKGLYAGYSEEDVIESAQKKGFNDFENHIKRTQQLIIPEKLQKVLVLQKKKKQLGAIRGISLTTDLLMAFIYKACENLGYKYSSYTGMALPSGVSWCELPEAAYLQNDGSVTTWGECLIPEGRMKSVIEQRAWTFAKFLDKGSEWHCFVYTEKGMAGKESNQGTHIHYLSHAWGHSRKDVVAQIKGGRYSLNTGNHILFNLYK